MDNDDDDRERVRGSDRTTIVTTDGGGRGGGTLVAVVLVIVLLVVLFVLFGDRLRGTAEDVEVPEEIDVNVNVEAPELRLPEVEVRQAPPPTQEPPANQDANSS